VVGARRAAPARMGEIDLEVKTRTGEEVSKVTVTKNPEYSAEQAKRLLKHYFSLLFKNNGLEWEGDNAGEVDAIVDLIVESAVNEVKHQRR